MSTRHKYMKTADGIHISYSFSYTSAAARVAATGLVSNDVGKFARQTDKDTIWMLTATTPVWKQVSLDINITEAAQGELIVHDGSDWVDFAVGTAGKILVTGGAAANPAWTGLATTKFFVGNGSGIPAAVAMSGDATMTNAGVVTTEANGMEFFIDGNCYVAENIVWKRIPKAFTSCSKVQIAVVTAPTGANIIVDVNYHASAPASAVTIFTTQGNRPEIAASAFIDDSGTPDVTALAAGGVVSVSIDQIGSTVAGAQLMVTLVP